MTARIELEPKKSYKNTINSTLAYEEKMLKTYIMKNYNYTKIIIHKNISDI